MSAGKPKERKVSVEYLDDRWLTVDGDTTRLDGDTLIVSLYGPDRFLAQEVLIPLGNVRRVTIEFRHPKGGK